jgi:hypothetical protein
MALAAWRACDPEEKDWQTFVVKGNLAHQRDRHWVNDRDDTTVMVSMRYTSNGPRERAKPDTERLSVIVSRDSTPQAAASRYLNGEVCEGYTPPKRVGNICWVRRVEKHPEGLRVYFHDVGRLVVRVRRADAPEERDVYAISSDGIVRRGKEERDHVPMKDGDTASLNQMEHDNCMFSASDKPGRSGVSAESRMWLPGLRPQSAEQFIEAVDPASPAK